MARSGRKNNERSLLATFLAISFVLGVLLGAVLTSTWIQGPIPLRLSPGEAYTRSITIVGVDKVTGEGRLATLAVELRAGTGRLLVEVPPYQEEDTQKAALDARSAAGLETGRGLTQVDVIISIENLAAEAIVAGPSASASIAVLIVAAINASENKTPSEVRRDVVVSAAINSTGRLQPVGGIREKYQTVRDNGEFTLFVVARTQPGYLPDYPHISVERALNLDELVGKVLR